MGCRASAADPKPPSIEPGAAPGAGAPVDAADSESGGREAPLDSAAQRVRPPRRQAESTDWIASAVTRRFGIGAGLAWVGFLAFGVVSEQLKTRTEVYLEQAGTRDVETPTETVLPNGVGITDLRVGGGALPGPGDLLVLSLVAQVSGGEKPFLDTTRQGNKDLVLTFGARTLKGGVTEGFVAALGSMRAGGKRMVRVPPDLGFGPEDVELLIQAGDKVVIPGGSELLYTIELKRVSIAPS